VRLLAISLQVLGPRIFTKLLTKLEIWFRDPEHFPDLQPKAREYIVALIDVAKSGSFWFGRLNLILFYIFGKYYRLSQRMTKIHYVSNPIWQKFDVLPNLLILAWLPGFYLRLCWLRQLQFNIPIDRKSWSSSSDIAGHFESSIQVERL